MCHAYAHEVQSFLTGVDAKGKTAKIDSRDDLRVLDWLAAWSGAAPQDGRSTRELWLELNETYNGATLTDAEKDLRECRLAGNDVAGLLNKLDVYVLDLTTYGRAYDDLDKLSLLKRSLRGIVASGDSRPASPAAALEVVWTEYSAAARAAERACAPAAPIATRTSSRKMRRCTSRLIVVSLLQNVFAFPRRT